MSRRRWTAVAVAVLIAVGLQPGNAAPSDSGDRALGEQLTTILGDARLDGASNALTVRDLDAGRTLYRTNGGNRLVPASNTKLLTSAAALDVLGPRYRFTTRVSATGRRTGSTLTGNLYLTGTGDPLITAADYDRLAAAVARTGVRTIRGAVAVDDSWFDATPLAPFWSWDDEPYYYSAQTSGLTVSPDDVGDAGTVLVDVAPGARAGAPTRITSTPANRYLHIHNTATTGRAGSAQTVEMVRRHGTNVVDVTGSIPVGASAFEDQPTVDAPTGLVADLFARYLARHGVRWTSRGVRHTTTPASARTIATHRSITLAALLTPFLKLSNNMIAEALTKSMGRATADRGTWAAGTAAILADIKALGVDTSTLQLFDGSGLGRADYNTTDELTNLLAAARDQPWFRTWYAALPIAGRPDPLVGGTLRKRLAGTAAAGNLHGKTGSMTGVSALSGYVTDADGHHLAFSMITNNSVTGGVSTVEDAVAVTLANHGDENAPRSTIRPAGTAPVDPRAQLECTWTRRC